MKVSDLNTEYGQPGRELGDKILYITSDGISEIVHGFQITKWDKKTFRASEVDDRIHKSAPMTPDMKTWDDARDALFGLPGRPDFTKVVA